MKSKFLLSSLLAAGLIAGGFTACATKLVWSFDLSTPGTAGLTKVLFARVFDPFFRADPSHNHAAEGCGLGLSIARWIVTAHGGTIQMASAPGSLTTVSVRLPEAAA